MPDPRETGRRLKELRQLRGMPQAELAKLAGVSSGAISQMETGQYVPRWETLDALGAALGVDVVVTLGPSEAQAAAATLIALWDHLSIAERAAVESLLVMLRDQHQARPGRISK